MLQHPPHELREKCFAALHAALVSNSGHMLRLGLLGVQVCRVTTTEKFLFDIEITNDYFQKLLRDNQFVSTNCDPPNDQQWLISQLLSCLCFPNWQKVSEEVVIELCKVIVDILSTSQISF